MTAAKTLAPEVICPTAKKVRPKAPVMASAPTTFLDWNRSPSSCWNVTAPVRSRRMATLRPTLPRP